MGIRRPRSKGGGVVNSGRAERDQRETVNGEYTIGAPNMAEAGRRVRKERSEVENC